jgi:hypothetical protein
LRNWQKATALVPLAMLSGAWTTSLALSSADAATKHPGQLPDGSNLPTQALKSPASVGVPGKIAPGVPAGSEKGVLAGASSNGIPAVALAAYQRAAQVIDQADPSCHIQWPLIAAIGRVESDHGRYGGNTLTSKGISEPGIYGIPLDGRNGTAKVTDTDAGQFDNDPIYDRAVGPMQFIPSTWSVVGVDADGDGQRNPQDINDASLATAVYLCSGNENLSTPAGQRSAVYRYNHSADYVNLVLSIMRAYAAGNYAAVPNGTATSTTFAPTPRAAAAPRHPQHRAAAGSSGGHHASGSGGSSGGSSSGGSGGSGGGGNPAPAPAPKPKPAPSQVTKPVKDVISGGSEAVNYCASQLSGIIGGLPQSGQNTIINKCAGKIAGMTKDQASAAIPNTLSGVLAWLGLTLAQVGGL